MGRGSKVCLCPEANIDCDLWRQVRVSKAIYTDASRIGRRLDMLRREFIAGAATSALLVCPLRAHAQQSATRRMRIGILIYSTPQRDPNTQTLLEGSGHPAARLRLPSSTP